MGKLDSKVALVTGGAAGIGAACVKRFVNEGARVLISDLDDGKGKSLASDLGPTVRYLRHDVGSASDWDEAVCEVTRHFGALDIVVNNAGITASARLVDFDPEEYQRVIAINQFGVFLGMRAAFPAMATGQGGSIINISSFNGMRGRAAGAAYVSSKFAVRGLTQVGALEGGPLGIRVNSVHPGLVETEMLATKPRREAVDAVISRLPIGRAGQPDEIANVVTFLASSESSYVTGSEYVVDGGWLSNP